MTAQPQKAQQPGFWQIIWHALRLAFGYQKPPKPKDVPNLFNRSPRLDPQLARRIVHTVLSEVEAAGGFIAIAILSSGGNPIICEKSVSLGAAFWKIAIDRAKDIANETSSATASMRESAVTLMHKGYAAGFLGVASPDPASQKQAVERALVVLRQAVDERRQAIIYNEELKKATNPPKKCRSCGKPLN